jgi:phosphoribosyl 1,2-cyclic phosphodiesterase
MKLKLWGTRGSLPAPLAPEVLEKRLIQVVSAALSQGVQDPANVEAFVRGLARHQGAGYGGNTPCVALTSQSGNTHAIIDGGSGIRLHSYELLKGPCGQGKGEVHLFFTHFHWDHLIGVPFFVPIFIPGNVIHVYAVQPDLPQVFETLFKKPYFPVPLDKLGAKIVYHQLEPRKPFKHGEMTITPYQLDHPDPCWGYRVECDGKVYSHCVDTECKRISREDLGPDLPLYQGVDLMVFDSQYTLVEQLEKVDWGHAAAALGLDIAFREAIKKIIFIHHDPASNDQKIADAEAQARGYFGAQQREAKRHHEPLPEVEWSFGYDGLEVEI